MHMPSFFYPSPPHGQGGVRLPEATLPEERGPTETRPRRKAETDRVFEGISEGFRSAEPGRVAPRGTGAIGNLRRLARQLHNLLRRFPQIVVHFQLELGL